MSDSHSFSRRTFMGVALLASRSKRTAAQGFAGLGGEAQGFSEVVPNVPLQFPRDLGSHPDFRIEWWYVTANLQDALGAQYGVQWTLFRQATISDTTGEGWSSRQLWMGHAAVTTVDRHYYMERLARGGVGQAGVDATPFRAWIDSWDMRGANAFSTPSSSPLQMTAAAPDFNFELRLETDRPLVLQGDAGYSKKSERGQASYYFSQPFFMASGLLKLNGNSVFVTGKAWMDREWSSQPLASDQTGWDWLSLHLNSGEKVMLFRLRQKDGSYYFAGNWISADGNSTLIASQSIAMTPVAFTEIEGRNLPTSWTIAIADRDFRIASVPLNSKSWMKTRFAYWEGPISFSGSHNGVGYLEMTGY